jgi:hypothetical protein
MCEVKRGTRAQGRVTKAEETDVEGAEREYGRKEGRRNMYERIKK